MFPFCILIGLSWGVAGYRTLAQYDVSWLGARGTLKGWFHHLQRFPFFWKHQPQNIV